MFPAIPPELLNILIQGGFAGLFIWLLIRTQDRQDKREERLLNQLDIHSQRMPEIVKALEILPEISKSLSEMGRLQIRLEERLRDIETSMKK